MQKCNVVIHCHKPSSISSEMGVINPPKVEAYGIALWQFNVAMEHHHNVNYIMAGYHHH
jgi:hypothetical protein